MQGLEWQCRDWSGNAGIAVAMQGLGAVYGVDCVM